MSPASNKARMLRYYRDVWGRADERVSDELIAADYLDRTPPPGVSPDRVGHVQIVAGLHAALSDIEVAVDDLIAEGDRVVGRWTLHGTHRGELLHKPPTGKRLTLTGIDIARFRDGQIAEIWHVEDLLGLLRQIQNPDQ